MDNIFKKQSLANPLMSTVLSMHKNSHIISKPKPKIRIIHVIAPEIIKTDVANFRELVQNLTGKPPADTQNRRQKIPKNKKPPTHPPPQPQKPIKDDPQDQEGLGGLDQAMTWQEGIGCESGSSSEGSLMNGFGNVFDGFVQEMGEFALLPMDLLHHHHHHHHHHHIIHGGFPENEEFHY